MVVYRIKFDNGREDVFHDGRFRKIEDYINTYVLINNMKEYDKVVDWYFKKTNQRLSQQYHNQIYIRYDGSMSCGSEVVFDEHCKGHRNITEKVLGKDTKGLLEHIITPRENTTVSMCDGVYNTNTICGSPNYVTQDQLDKTLLTFNQKKMQTIQEKLFEKFLNKNEKKILDAVETSQENTERFGSIQTKLSSIVCDYSTTRARLTDGYNTADQKKIEEQLTKLDKFNKLFGNDMFNQLSVIRDKIEKSMDKFIN